ncbi:MAG: ABC-2 transporter permease [Defluviitaleaceae bacterium]|nr:ABC-2 transporter permease [Defluviitaleaceae bacterium]
MDGIFYAYKLCIRRYAVVIGLMLAHAFFFIITPAFQATTPATLIILSIAPVCYIGAEKYLKNLRIYSRVMPVTSRTLITSKYLMYIALQAATVLIAVAAITLHAVFTGNWNINTAGFAAGLGFWLSYIGCHICLQNYVTRQKITQQDAEDGVNIIIMIVPMLQTYLVTGPRQWNAFVSGLLGRNDDFSLALISDARWLIFLGISVALFTLAFPVAVVVHRERE